MFMSDAPAPSLPIEPTRVGRLLTLLRKLIDYGRELATTLQRPGANTDPATHQRTFGTTDIALILQRITRGLAIAFALEDRLVRNAARLNAPSRPQRPRAQREPRPAPPTAAPDGPALADHLPTSDQIAAAVRRRPIGTVIADICRDLGISPSHKLWRELTLAIARHGGSTARLLGYILDRAFPLAAEARRRFSSAAGPQPPPAQAGTGPP